MSSSSSFKDRKNKGWLAELRGMYIHTVDEGKGKKIMYVMLRLLGRDKILFETT